MFEYLSSRSRNRTILYYIFLYRFQLPIWNTIVNFPTCSIVLFFYQRFIARQFSLIQRLIFTNTIASSIVSSIVNTIVNLTTFSS